MVRAKSWRLSQRSKNNLVGVHKYLVEILYAALDESPYDFTVTEGLRTKERQKELYEAGKSTTMNSRHLIGQAFDVMMYDENGKGTWDMKYYKAFNEVVQKIAKRKQYKVTWGGSWESFVDGPHFQIELN